MVIKKANREELINSNYGLVHSCANRFRAKGIEYDDLYQAGCIGLIKAVDGFDESRGFAFSTYAVPVILGEIKKLFRDGGAIKISRSIKEKALKAQRFRESFMKEKLREPTVSELAELLGLDFNETAEVLTASQPPLSLTYDSEDGSGEFDVAVNDEDKMFDHISLYEVIERLSEQDKLLVQLRYFKGMTQTKAAAILGVSQVQVSRREKTILSKMREILNE